MADNTRVKCAHPACICTVAEDENFCSQYCEDAGEEDVEISCDCGHTGCSISDAPVMSEAPARVVG